MPIFRSKINLYLMLTHLICLKMFALNLKDISISIMLLFKNLSAVDKPTVKKTGTVPDLTSCS